jgi:glycosyltransferase involved in cell wall biosynthesis
MFKIVQMLPALGWGGAQMFCIQLCNELAKYPGYEVTLVSLYDHNSTHMSTDLIDERVKFITLGKKKGFDAKIFKKVYNLLQEIKPDVVHTHLHSGYYVTLAYLMMNDPATRKIHTFHSLVTKDAPWHGRLIYKYFFQRGIIHPVSISEEVFKGAVEEYNDCIKTLIHNGSVPVQSSSKFQSVTDTITGLKKNKDTKVLVNVGRIYKVKNQQLIIDTMKILEAEGENAIALIIGGLLAKDHPAYLQEDEELYDQLIQNKPKNVHFIGKVNNVGDYLLNADAFLLPSLYEGLPISLLEAMSAGAVPVCTPVGGLLDIIKPNIGFLSKDLSTESYLAALKAFLHSDNQTIEKLKANCKAVYQSEFSMESCAAKYNKLYHNNMTGFIIIMLCSNFLSQTIAIL